MDAVNIKQTIFSPRTTLDKKLGIFEICGNSYMSNPLIHYSIVSDWLNEYVKDPLEETKFIIDLEYTNSASKKLLHDSIKLLLKVKESGRKVEIHWLYDEDDEDVMDTGKQCEKSIALPFVFIKK